MHSFDAHIQINPRDTVDVYRQSCGEGAHWIKISELPIHYSILIDGATAEEIDAIVNAINAPIMRRREELAAKIAAFRANYTDAARPAA